MQKSNARRRKGGEWMGIAALVALTALGCGLLPTRLSPGSEPDGASPTATSSAPTPTPTVVSTPTPTTPPTPGPGMDELLMTPQALVDAGQPEAALAALDDVAALYPDQAAPYSQRATVYRALGDSEAALADLWAAFERAPDDAEVMAALLLALEGAGAYQDVVNAYDVALQGSPDDVDLLVGRAAALARLGDPEAALADLERAQALNPSRSDAWYAAAAAAYNAGHYSSAIAIATPGINSFPEATNLLQMRGLAYLASGEADMAATDLSKVIELDPTHYAAYHMRGEAYIRQGDVAAAAEDFQKAAELGVGAGVIGGSEALLAAADAADALAQVQAPKAGFDYLAQYTIQYGSRDPLLLGVARVYFREGNTAAALRYLDNLVEEGKYHPALYWRAVVLAAEGRDQEASADLRAFLEATPFGVRAERARKLLVELEGG